MLQYQIQQHDTWDIVEHHPENNDWVGLWVDPWKYPADSKWHHEKEIA